jgi:hypothetical protein
MCEAVVVHGVVYLWHCSQVVGYFAGLAVWVAGRCDRWQFEQLAVVTTCVAVVHGVVYLWHCSQVVGYFAGLAV